MRQFAIRQFNAASVVSVDPTPPDPLTDNVSRVESAAVIGLDSLYEWQGVNASYYRRATDTSTTVRIMKLTQTETESEDNGRLVLTETMQVMVRRYHNGGFDRPQEGDRLTLEAYGSQRTYRVTQRPVQSVDQLEYKFEVSRTAGKRQVTPGTVSRI
jgi:hypothetical protein